MKNIEIEVKVEVSKQQFQDLLSKMQSQAQLVKDSVQTDIYYSPKGEDYFKIKTKALRVREEDGKASFDYKEIFFENDAAKKHIKELSVKVDDIFKLDEIMQILNITKIITLVKHRQEFKYKDCLVAMDTIEGLGCFVEVELDCVASSVEQANTMLAEKLKELKLDQCPVNTKGYANMLYAKTYENK